MISNPTGAIVAQATKRGKNSRTTSDRFGFPRRRYHGSILSTVSKPAMSAVGDFKLGEITNRGISIRPH